MSKILLVVFSVCLLQFCIAAPATSNSIDASDKPALEPEEPVPENDLKPAHDVIAAIYQKAMVNALQTKVSELQQKLSSGDNAIPAAVDILKITLLSTPTQDAIRKAAENVMNLITPEMKKLVPQVFEESSTTALPEKSST